MKTYLYWLDIRLILFINLAKPLYDSDISEYFKSSYDSIALAEFGHLLNSFFRHQLGDVPATYEFSCPQLQLTHLAFC